MTINNKNRSLLFPRIGKFSMVVFALLLIIAGIRAFELFGYIFKENIKSDSVVLIPTGSDFDDVEKILREKDVLHNYKAFSWVSKKKEYRKNIRPGRYEIQKGWNTNQLVNHLRAGNQSPVKVTFNNLRTFNELAGKVSVYFEFDSLALLNELNTIGLPEEYGFSEVTFPVMFLPNTYEFYWTTSPSMFIERMYAEYQAFWNTTRKEKAENIGMTPIEVSTLASIVQEETIKAEEKPTIAGLYINRLKRGMLLQADPTVKYAVGDFTIRRINNKMLETDSPYNTYKNAGLPPGPINFPEVSTINAVLNAEQHNYLYMCAREDFSGYHNFTTTLRQHNINAAKYRKELNKNKIWK
jgi:UPF0755 protein